jgi:hypothetical protein
VREACREVASLEPSRSDEGADSEQNDGCNLESIFEVAGGLDEAE